MPGEGPGPQGRPEVPPYDRFETLDALIRVERRIRGQSYAEPYVAAALAAAREALADLAPTQHARLESLLRFKAGADVPGAVLVSALGHLLEEIPDSVRVLDPRTHTNRPRGDRGRRTHGRARPAGDRRVLRAAGSNRGVPPAEGADARYLWSLTNVLLQPGHEREDLSRHFAGRLREASMSLPPEHWIRREAERLRDRLGGE